MSVVNVWKGPMSGISISITWILLDRLISPGIVLELDKQISLMRHSKNVVDGIETAASSRHRAGLMSQHSSSTFISMIDFV